MAMFQGETRFLNKHMFSELPNPQPYKIRDGASRFGPATDVNVGEVLPQQSHLFLDMIPAKKKLANLGMKSSSRFCSVRFQLSSGR